nr:MAG TPA: hypothetical protein [Caudoviricetes sp.]
MERLTYRDKDGFPMMKKRGGFKQEGVERLAAYEDTGRTTEEVTALGNLFDYVLEESKTLTGQLALLNRIRDLARADRAGRLVVLPCEVGTATYYIHYPIAVYPDKSEPEIKRGIFTLCDLDRVGHSVFLTREEAENALEAMEGMEDV